LIQARTKASELEKQIATLEAQKKHWREKAQEQEKAPPIDKIWQEKIELKIEG